MSLQQDHPQVMERKNKPSTKVQSRIGKQKPNKPSTKVQSRLGKQKPKSSKIRKQAVENTDNSSSRKEVEEQTQGEEEAKEAENEDHDAAVSSTNNNTDDKLLWRFEEDVIRLLEGYKKYSDDEGRVFDKTVFYNAILSDSESGFRNKSINPQKVFDKLKKLKEWYRGRNGDKKGLNAKAMARYDLLHAVLRVDPARIPHDEFMEEFFRRKRLGFPVEGIRSDQ